MGVEANNLLILNYDQFLTGFVGKYNIFFLLFPMQEINMVVSQVILAAQCKI